MIRTIYQEQEQFDKNDLSKTSSIDIQFTISDQLFLDVLATNGNTK